MAYKIYKQKVTKEQYFKRWDPEQFSKLSDELQEQLYQDFLFKKDVLVRDSFTCQNISRDSETKELGPCVNCKNEHEFGKLTVHHIKHKRNGGENKIRNGVTICDGSHQAFNRQKRPLIFPKEAEYLPPHIRGHTFRLCKADREKNWKEIRAEMQKLRKDYKHLGGKSLNWKMVEILLRWLYKNT